jgi:hypothetical protein
MMPRVEHQNVRTEGARVGDIDFVEQVQFDDFKLDAGLLGVGAKAANLWPGFGGRHDFMAAPREFDGRAAAEAGTGSCDQNFL